jgi:hypothetical protein
MQPKDRYRHMAGQPLARAAPRQFRCPVTSDVDVVANRRRAINAIAQGCADGDALTYCTRGPNAHMATDEDSAEMPDLEAWPDHRVRI